VRPERSKANWLIAPAVSTWVTVAPNACAAGVVPSAPRITVKVFPETPVTRRISSSTLSRNWGRGGKRMALATSKVSATGDMPPAVDIVVWARLANLSTDISAAHGQSDG
jgi:hypothetical protein